MQAVQSRQAGQGAVVRIRSTKPEFWKSKTIADALGWSDRLVLKGLEAYVDDNGVGKDDIELIATEVFPRDTFRSPRETVGRLSEAISRIHQAGLIARYEVDGEKFLYVDKWKDLQRIDKPSKGRYPRPDGSFEYIQPVNRESYRSPREGFGSPPENLAPGTGEQGNRGTGEIPAAVGNVTTQRDNDEPKSGPSESATIGAQLVAQANLPDGIPKQTLAKLRVNATNLVCAGSAPAHVLAALRTYGTRTGVTPGLLADLVADEAKRVNGTEFTNHRPATSDLRAAQAQALKNNPPSRLELE